jgi:hypothetical protein
MKHLFSVLWFIAATAGVAALVQPGGSPLTAEQQQQISKMAVMSEDKRVKAENIDSVMKADFVLLDVREPKEIEQLGGYEGSINIPITELEKRLGELPKDKTFLTA